jgi:hypothetical protein
MEETQISLAMGATSSPASTDPAMYAPAGAFQAAATGSTTPGKEKVYQTTDKQLPTPESSIKQTPRPMIAVRQPRPKAPSNRAQTSSSSPTSLPVELSDEDSASTGTTTPLAQPLSLHSILGDIQPCDKWDLHRTYLPSVLNFVLGILGHRFPACWRFS